MNRLGFFGLGVAVSGALAAFPGSASASAIPISILVAPTRTYTLNNPCIFAGSGTVTVLPGIDSCSGYTPFTTPASTTKTVLTFSYGDIGNDGAEVDPFAVDPVPEPASLVLIGSGLVGIGLVVRRLGRGRRP